MKATQSMVILLSILGSLTPAVSSAQAPDQAKAPDAPPAVSVSMKDLKIAVRLLFDDHIGHEGAFLLKLGDTYVLSGSDHYDGKYTCWIATSKNIDGPSSARYPAIPFGGHNMFFKDKEDHWWSTIFNGPINEKPCVLPVDIQRNGQVSLRKEP